MLAGYNNYFVLTELCCNIVVSLVLVLFITWIPTSFLFSLRSSIAIAYTYVMCDRSIRVITSQWYYHRVMLEVHIMCRLKPHQKDVRQIFLLQVSILQRLKGERLANKMATTPQQIIQ